MTEIPNILASRYASPEMAAIWSPAGKIIRERKFWLAVLKAQQELGLDIPQEAIEAYQSVLEHVDLDSIRRRERLLKHDVKARLEEFCALAGHEHIHRGMTSRDLTENVEQWQIREALQLVRRKAVSALLALSGPAEEWKGQVLTGRTHNVAAQPTTLGRRFAMFGEDLLLALNRLDQLIENYPARGLKGAVGTQADQLAFFDGDAAKVEELETRVLQHLGFKNLLIAPGQIYPRSLDFEVVGALFQLASGPGGFATTLRLMAGQELASEGFGKNQVGSTAMPHKVNCRSCERIAGFCTLLEGYLAMTAKLSGSQWNEGDVSCSVVRRVALPDSFFVIDGLLETFLSVLQNLEVYPEAMARENARYGPFLSCGAILTEAVRNGVGRETAHGLIKEHALAAVKDLRTGKTEKNDLIDRLAADGRLELTPEKLKSIVGQEDELIGLAVSQVDAFNSRLASWKTRFPESSSYVGGDIL